MMEQYYNTEQCPICHLMTMMVIRLVMMLMIVIYDANCDYNQDYEC